MADDFGYHIDHHGSLVRPPQLLAARAAGLSDEELAAVTDEAVVALAHALRRLTLNAVCDGQYRRAYFESVIHDQVAGFGSVAGPAPLSDLAGIGATRRRGVPSGAALTAAGRLATWPRPDRRFLRRVIWTECGRRARRSPRSCGTRSPRWPRTACCTSRW